MQEKNKPPFSCKSLRGRRRPNSRPLRQSSLAECSTPPPLRSRLTQACAKGLPKGDRRSERQSGDINVFYLKYKITL